MFGESRRFIFEIFFSFRNEVVCEASGLILSSCVCVCGGGGFRGRVGKGWFWFCGEWVKNIVDVLEIKI